VTNEMPSLPAYLARTRTAGPPAGSEKPDRAQQSATHRLNSLGSVIDSICRRYEGIGWSSFTATRRPNVAPMKPKRTIPSE
jgi:hypothetical protein